MHSRQSLTNALLERARELGFELTGVCAAATPPRWELFRSWLQRGYAGEMHYLTERQDAYAHPDAILNGARSLVMLGMNYGGGKNESPLNRSHQPQECIGLVSRYASGRVDYHDLIHARLKGLIEYLQQLRPGCQARGVVDTAPLLERDFAQLAGLGWTGKHTLLLNRTWGSWFFLAALLTDEVLEYDAPSIDDYCGTCRACLDACPTGAFPQPYVLDATRCISYLTIELRRPIPEHLRAGIGNWVFGCDICQEVCPWNRRAPAATLPEFQTESQEQSLDLLELLQLSEDAFRQRFRSTPVWRTKRKGLLRNAAIALGNERNPRAIPALCAALHDAEPLVRGAAAWALGQYDQASTRAALEQRKGLEADPEVMHEICVALRAAIV